MSWFTERELLFCDSLGLRRCGQPEPESGDSALRLRTDLPAYGLDQLFHDGKADARPTARGVAGFLDSVEAFENVAEVAGWDSRTGVGNRDQDGVPLLLGAHPHRAGGRGVARRVMQQVRYELGQRIRVGAR